jgi:hypothetical protein
MGSRNGLPREEIQLFLARNQICTIPIELFRLTRLTVLSLRESCLFSYSQIQHIISTGGNNISYLPPEIRHLTNLRELNVSNNRLTYLPSEIVQMQLSQLYLHPNPFIPEPPPPTQEIPLAPLPSQIAPKEEIASARLARHRTAANALKGSRCTVSNTTSTFHRVPPLTELCLRVLISPSLTSSSSEPNLKSLYFYPISPDPPPDGYGISEPLRDILNACVPGSISEPNTFKPTVQKKTITGIGVCQAPKHVGKEGDGTGMFVYHGEERYTWEEVVGGVRVGERVCCRWRGCQHGCLDYLAGGDDEEEDPPVEEDMDLREDETEVVQLVTFGDGLHF